jgi:glycerophosphoryl diester phosphodiesterase
MGWSWRGCRWLLAAILSTLVLCPSAAAELTGRLDRRAVLPADTAAPGPPSGAALVTGPFNGFPPPYANQPVQGFSGVLRAGPNQWWAIPDNGYGRKELSADWLLRVYRVRTELSPPGGGTGTAAVEGYIELRDPDGIFPYPLVRADRLLTGADLDPESIAEAADGSFWVGDEFGPWMLHFDRDGRLLDPPAPLAGVKSPQNPTLLPKEAPTLDRSKGFEAVAAAPNGHRAFVFLEGALLADPDQRRRFIYEFDLDSNRFTGSRWEYRTADPGWLVADAKALDRRRLLVMERDDFEGTQAVFKRVHEIELGDPEEGGARPGKREDFVPKRELVDLLALRDPSGASLPSAPGDRGLGNPFSFPLRSVESILPLDHGRLLVANDNNFPFDAGRHDGVADGNEWIVVEATKPGVRIAGGRLEAKAGKRLVVRYRLERDAAVTVEVVRHDRVVVEETSGASAGHRELAVDAPHKRGSYRVRVVARLGNVSDRDVAELRVRR